MKRRLDKQTRLRFRYVCASPNTQHVFVIEVGKDDLHETDEDQTIDCLRCPVCHSPAALAVKEAEVVKVVTGIAGVTKRGRHFFVNTQDQSKIEAVMLALDISTHSYHLTFAELRLVEHKG